MWFVSLATFNGQLCQVVKASALGQNLSADIHGFDSHSCHFLVRLDLCFAISLSPLCSMTSSAPPNFFPGLKEAILRRFRDLKRVEEPS